MSYGKQSKENQHKQGLALAHQSPRLTNMSANNQILIKEHNGKFYVFGNVNAESWGWNEETNTPEPNFLDAKIAYAVCETRDDATGKAIELLYKDETEYGINYGTLVKDGAEVEIRD